MPQILVNLTLDEIRIAVSRYVAEECDIEVDARSLNFEHGQDGGVTGASFDVIRTPADIEDGGAIAMTPEPGPATSTSEPIFTLVNFKTGNVKVQGDPSQVIGMIHGNMGNAMNQARAWMKTAQAGDQVELKTTRGEPVYILKRLS